MQGSIPKIINNGVAENTLKQEIADLNRNLTVLSKSNKKRNVILRGLLNGVFTAIGASLGFALFLTGFANFLKTAEGVPFVDRLIDKTHLEEIIERYMNDIERPDPTPAPQPSSTPIPPTRTPIPTVTSVPTVTLTPTDTESD